MWAKMCPKCGGDLYLRKDLYVNDIACLQCGLILSPVQEVELVLRLRQKEVRERQAA